MGTQRCGCAVYTKPNLIHLFKGILPVWREGDHITFLCWSFNTRREVVLGDQPTVTDSWACYRFLFLSLLSIKNIFKAAFAYSSPGVSQTWRILFHWRRCSEVFFIIPLWPTDWHSVTERGPPSPTGHEGSAQLLLLGEHQGAAAHPVAFQTVMATDFQGQKILSSQDNFQDGKDHPFPQIQTEIFNFLNISKQANFSVLSQYLQQSQSGLFLMICKIHFEMSSHFWPK